MCLSVRKIGVLLMAVLMLGGWGGAAEGALDMARAAVKYPEVVYLKGKPQMNVALTFDDGPDGHYTPAILDILKEKGAPATFFVVGYRVRSNPEVVKRIVNEGHCLANHSWNHPDMSRLGAQNIAAQLNATDNLVQQITGVHTTLFRPPYGAMNESVISVANQLGYKVILWSVDPQDWRNYPAQTVLQRIVGSVTPGAIILQHCTNNGTLQSLSTLIDKLRAMGYNLVTLPELLDYQVTIPIQLVVNGQKLEKFQTPPYQTQSGTAMVPLQEVLQAINFQGEFSVTGKQVTIYREGQAAPVTIDLTKAETNQNKVLVPVRALANVLNLELGWDESSKTITLNQPPPKEEQVSLKVRDSKVALVADGGNPLGNQHWLCDFII